MRFFTRTAPTVLPCAAGSGSVGSVSASGAPSSSSPVGSTEPSAAKSPRRAPPETPWEF